MYYIISNLPKVATWRSKGFRIGPLIAEKSTTLLITGTLGHTVIEKMPCTEIGRKARLFDKLLPGRAGKRINST